MRHRTRIETHKSAYKIEFTLLSGHAHIGFVHPERSVMIINSGMKSVQLTLQLRPNSTTSGSAGTTTIPEACSTGATRHAVSISAVNVAAKSILYISILLVRRPKYDAHP